VFNGREIVSSTLACQALYKWRRSEGKLSPLARGLRFIDLEVWTVGFGRVTLCRSAQHLVEFDRDAFNHTSILGWSG
jgi:hypothetical protein